MTELLPLAMLGGLLGLDVVCFPQMMISRPLVGATIAGAFVGGFVVQWLGGPGVSGINLVSILVATLGAIILLAIYRLITRRAV